jgi:N-acetylglutamate synthase-like GNAT family acetyltransferase
MTSAINSNQAATTIQAAFRGYQVRKRKPVAAAAAAAAAVPQQNKLSPNQKVYITKIDDPQEFPKLASLINSWQMMLEQEWNRASSSQRSWSRDFVEGQWQVQIKKSGILADARLAARMMRYSLLNSPEIQVLVCRDDQVQGIATFVEVESEQEMRIHLLLTHPDNLRSQEKASIKTRTEGAGTQLVLSLLQRALDKQLDVVLRATNSSLLFWDRFDFELLDPNPQDQKHETTPMKLSRLQLEDVLRKFQKPQPAAAARKDESSDERKN